MDLSSSYQNRSLPASVQRYIDRMPRLSTTTAKVVEICNRYESSADDLNYVISIDPVLTGQILKLINSAYCGLMSEITSLTRAIVMLGVNTVKNIALSSIILKYISMCPSSSRSFMDSFWSHCLNVGVISKALAAIHRIPDIYHEEFFVAGLIHDLGKIPLYATFPEACARIYECDIHDFDRICQNELDELGTHHGEIGRIIGEKWNLGPALTGALAFHHCPDQMDEKNRSLVTIVAIADIFSIAFREELSEDSVLKIQSLNRLLNEAGIRMLNVSALRNTVSSEIEKAELFLDIIHKG